MRIGTARTTNQLRRDDMNRYFRVSNKDLTSIETCTRGGRSYREPPKRARAALARLLGVADSHWHDPYAYSDTTPSVSDIIREAETWIVEERLYNMNEDGGMGWVAITVGEDRTPPATRGIHIDDLSDYQREYVERAAHNAGIDLYAEA